MYEFGPNMKLLSMEQNEFENLRMLVHQHAGIWLRDGKQVMLASRLSRRLRFHGMISFSEYYKYVCNCNDGGAEIGELINCVTTNKTSFFREAHHFDFLTETMIPEKLRSFRGSSRRSTPENKTIRIWSAASSTGEEPYTIAMTLLEARKQWLELAPYGWNIRIVASDIDTEVLTSAQNAVYDGSALRDIPFELHKKYFLRGTGSATGQIKVKPSLSSLVEFMRINLVDPTWPLQEAFDAIFLRNALIYFNHESQNMILRRMAKLLNPGGYLFLGHSEHIPWLHDIYEPLHKTIFRLRDVAKTSAG